jgi:hypothetical protein
MDRYRNVISLILFLSVICLGAATDSLQVRKHIANDTGYITSDSGKFNKMQVVNKIHGNIDSADASNKLDGLHASAFAKHSTGTAGYIPQYSGDTTKNSPIYTNGTNIGIGTTSPTSMLDVYLSDGGSTNYLATTMIKARTFFTVDSYLGLTPTSIGLVRPANTGSNLTISASVLAASTGGNIIFSPQDNVADNTPTERMRITKAGNVGIGTTSPTEILEVQGINKSIVMAGLSISGGANTPGIVIRGQRGGEGAQAALQSGDRYGGHYFLGQYDGTAGHTYAGASIEVLAAEDFSSGHAGTYLILSTSKIGESSRTERMRILDNGNVGIGTTSPTSKLQVVGLIEYADNASAVAAGLTAGAFYRTGDLLKVVH